MPKDQVGAGKAKKGLSSEMVKRLVENGVRYANSIEGGEPLLV